MFPVVGLEAAQDAIVDDLDVVPTGKGIGGAGDEVEVVGDAGVEAAAVDGCALEVDVLVAVVGVEVPAVGEEVVAGVGEGSLIALDLLPIGFTDEGADGDDAVGIEGEGSLRGQELAPPSPMFNLPQEQRCAMVRLKLKFLVGIYMGTAS